jgi:hypothetical protein
MINQLRRRISDSAPLKCNECANVLFKRYIIVRVYIIISIFLSALTMILDQTSTLWQAASLTQAPEIFSWFSVIVCVVALIDMLINDLLPRNIVFLPAYEYRHFTYMALSLISFSISISIFDIFGTSFILVRLWLDGSVAAVIAILSIFSRHRVVV